MAMIENLYLALLILKPLGRTGLSVVYTEMSNPGSGLKAEEFWIDGQLCDRAAFDESETLLSFGQSVVEFKHCAL